MGNKYTAIIKQDGDWWIGWIEEIAGVNCQEISREELMKSLQITLKEALEFNRREAIHAAESDFHEEHEGHNSATYLMKPNHGFRRFH